MSNPKDALGSLTLNYKRKSSKRLVFN